MRKALSRSKSSSFSYFKSQKGSIVTTLGITTAILALSIGLGSYVLNTQKMAKVVSNEGLSRLLNNLVLTRVTQAVASTAILCNSGTEMCYWTKKAQNTVPDNFRFSDVVESSAKGEPMTLNAEVCIPEFTDAGPNLTNCENKIAKVEIRIKDISQLLNTDNSTGQVGVISGDYNRDKADDQDSFGILMTVSSTYKDFNQEDKILVSTAIVRRPRILLRISTQDSFCSPTCQVSVFSDGENEITKSQDFCLGRTKIVNNQSNAYTFNSTSSNNTSALSAFNSTNATIKYRVHNDGPGYMYGYKINRKFTPNPLFQFAPGESAPPEQQVFSSFDEKDRSSLEVEAGGSVEVTDTGLRCYDEKITNTNVVNNYNTIVRTIRMTDRQALGRVLRNHRFDGGALYSRTFTPFSLQSSVTHIDSITASPSNPKPSGSVGYSYALVEPQNALSLGTAAQDLSGTKTTTAQTETNTYTRQQTDLILINTGMN